jgi:tetratricopeptide (TPR) repeat protein
VYRVIADAVGWRRHTPSPTHQWEVEVRQPRTPEEQLKFHTAEGGIALTDGDLEQAVRHYEKAVALDRSRAGVLESLASAYEKLDRLPEALRLWQEAYLIVKRRPKPELCVHGYYARVPWCWPATSRRRRPCFAKMGRPSRRLRDS